MFNIILSIPPEFLSAGVGMVMGAVFCFFGEILTPDDIV